METRFKTLCCLTLPFPWEVVQQLRDLIEGGADGVHLYAMNDAKVAAAVYEGIKDLL